MQALNAEQWRVVDEQNGGVRIPGIVQRLEDFDQLLANPQVGESWEAFVIEQLVNALPRWRPSFVRTGNGAEIELLLERGGQRRVFEIKLSKAPKPSRGFYQLIEDIKPDSATVIAPIDEPFASSAGVWAMDLGSAIASWR
jgi:hypothetical protein